VEIDPSEPLASPQVGLLVVQEMVADQHPGDQKLAMDGLVAERAERDQVLVHVRSTLRPRQKVVAMEAAEGALAAGAAAPFGGDFRPTRIGVALTPRWLRVGLYGDAHFFLQSACE
jgi:hypothetical protein